MVSAGERSARPRPPPLVTPLLLAIRLTGLMLSIMHFSDNYLSVYTSLSLSLIIDRLAYCTGLHTLRRSRCAFDKRLCTGDIVASFIAQDEKTQQHHQPHQRRQLLQLRLYQPLAPASDARADVRPMRMRSRVAIADGNEKIKTQR